MNFIRKFIRNIPTERMCRTGNGNYNSQNDSACGPPPPKRIHLEPIVKSKLICLSMFI